jgi:hypothetical protein
MSPFINGEIYDSDTILKLDRMTLAVVGAGVSSNSPPVGLLISINENHHIIISPNIYIRLPFDQLNTQVRSSTTELPGC